VLEIVYNSDKSVSDRSSDSVSSSDNETDDIADAIISDDSGDEEEILHRDFRWKTTGHRVVFICDFGPRNGAENVTLYNVLSFFFDKEITQQIVRETNRYTEQNKNTHGNLFSFRSDVRSTKGKETETPLYVIL
jgi:hypothetical protein